MVTKEQYKDGKNLIELKHKYKMEELIFERESNKIYHDRELEKIRIKSAEIRKQQERKQLQDMR